jgi:hypothetical protein
MFASVLFDSVLPAYGVIGLTLLLLLGAAIVVASRVLTSRRVPCPVQAVEAGIVLESQKRFPWSQERRTSVAQCSLLPNGVTCEQNCLKR